MKSLLACRVQKNDHIRPTYLTWSSRAFKDVHCPLHFKNPFIKSSSTFYYIHYTTLFVTISQTQVPRTTETCHDIEFLRIYYVIRLKWVEFTRGSTLHLYSNYTNMCNQIASLPCKLSRVNIRQHKKHFFLVYSSEQQPQNKKLCVFLIVVINSQNSVECQ